MDSKTVIMNEKQRLWDNNKGQKQSLDQLVQVRILVPQYFDLFALRFHKGLAHYGPEQERSEATKASKGQY